MTEDKVDHPKIVATPVPETYNKETVIKTLHSEGMILTGATTSLDMVTPDSIIAAQHTCIVKMREDIQNQGRSVMDLHNRLNDFYLAAQRAGIVISRNEKQQIVMTPAR